MNAHTFPELRRWPLGGLVDPRPDRTIAREAGGELTAPVSLAQRSALRDLNKGPLLKDMWGFGAHRPATIAALSVAGLCVIDMAVTGSEAHERATITPAGMALVATWPQLFRRHDAPRRRLERILASAVRR